MEAILIVEDDADNIILQIQTYDRTDEEIANAIASLEAVYPLCVVYAFEEAE